MLVTVTFKLMPETKEELVGELWRAVSGVQGSNGTVQRKGWLWRNALNRRFNLHHRYYRLKQVMENIFIGLYILFSVSILSLAILFLLFRGEINNMPKGDIVYDHIEEELPKKVVKRKKSTTNPKRKYKKDEKGPVA